MFTQNDGLAIIPFTKFFVRVSTFSTIILLLDNSYTGTIATASGWGTLKEEGTPSCTLREVDVKVMSNEECRKTNYTENLISDKMMCAGDLKGGKDTCQV